MAEFLELLPPLEALSRLLDKLPRESNCETVPTEESLGRVTCRPVEAPHPLPTFARSTVDGYAVRAADTFGANDSLPAYVNLAAEVPMGAPADFEISRGECALIHTGGMLPKGSDAVVMVEHTQAAQPGEVEILRSVAVGENVIKIGEDVAEGQLVIPIGVRIRPAEIGGLMALGITRVAVSRRPRVAILSSGDEVVPPDADIQVGQVRDVNSYTLSALVQEAGGIASRYGIMRDEFESMRSVAGKALAENDLVVITAGSSASARDLTSRVINEIGDPGVLVHGVNVRPGKPTILAVCEGKPVVGLPGNPVSALVIASLFVSPVIRAMSGVQSSRPHPSVRAYLSVNLSSQAGREDYVPIHLETGPEGYRAEPIFGKSNLIFTLVKADGLIRIPADANGLSAGELVDVTLMV